MLIDFQLEQQKRFDAAAQRLLQQAQRDLQFDSMADFYRASWLTEFPQGTQWAVSGLDDGAEQYCIRIAYKTQYLLIDCGARLSAVHYDRNRQKCRYELD